MLSQQHPLSCSTLSPFFIKILYYLQDLIQVPHKKSAPIKKSIYPLSPLGLLPNHSDLLCLLA